MPTIEEKIEASKAIETELLSRLLALPGAVVTDERGEDLLHSINLQRNRTWELGRFAPDRCFGLQGQLSCDQAAQQASAPVPSDLQKAHLLGAIGPEDYQKLADSYTVDAAEPEPPTLVATEPPAPAEPV